MVCWDFIFLLWACIVYLKITEMLIFKNESKMSIGRLPNSVVASALKASEEAALADGLSTFQRVG